MAERQSDAGAPLPFCQSQLHIDTVQYPVPSRPTPQDMASKSRVQLVVSFDGLFGELGAPCSLEDVVLAVDPATTIGGLKAIIKGEAPDGTLLPACMALFRKGDDSKIGVATTVGDAGLQGTIVVRGTNVAPVQRQPPTPST